MKVRVEFFFSSVVVVVAGGKKITVKRRSGCHLVVSFCLVVCCKNLNSNFNSDYVKQSPIIINQLTTL